MKYASSLVAKLGAATLSLAHLIDDAYLSWLSQPQGERSIYRVIRRARPVRIVELGIGSGRRAERMMRTAVRYANGRGVSYTGIDGFEANEATVVRISLKQAHQQLRCSGCQVRLLPGDPYAVISRHANSLSDTDLLVISADQPVPPQLWYFVPRMLHDASSVLLQNPQSTPNPAAFRLVSASAVRTLAEQATERRAAA